MPYTKKLLNLGALIQSKTFQFIFHLHLIFFLNQFFNYNIIPLIYLFFQISIFVNLILFLFTTLTPPTFLKPLTVSYTFLSNSLALKQNFISIYLIPHLFQSNLLIDFSRTYFRIVFSNFQILTIQNILQLFILIFIALIDCSPSKHLLKCPQISFLHSFSL